MASASPSTRSGSQAGILILAFALALGLHAFWLAAPLKSPTPAVRITPPVVTAYVRELPGGWSPTLFSLPSPTGFSGAIKQDQLQTAPPLQSPLRLTDDISLPSSSAGIPNQQHWEIPVSLPGLKTLRVPFSHPGTAMLSGWTLTILEPGDVQVQLSRKPAGIPKSVELELRGEITFDESGRVNSMLVHPPLPADPVAREAVQVLRRLTSEEARPGQILKFRFTYRRPLEGS